MNCIATAVARLLDIPIQEIVDFVKHDGTDIIFPEQDAPKCFRGFHIQEMVDFCYSRGLALTQIETYSFTAHSDNSPDAEFLDYKYTNNQDRIIRYLDQNDGIIIGLVHCKFYHAVAWKNKTLLTDNPTLGRVIWYPDGRFMIDDIMIREFWLIRCISQQSI